MGRKKKEVNLDELNIDELLEEAVNSSILGRILASYAAVLTNKEKKDIERVYRMLQAGKKPSEELPYVVNSSKNLKDNVKKYTPTEAIKRFSEQYPKEAQPLLSILEERHSETKPVISYGLREEYDLDDDYCINFLTSTLGITKGPARQLYEKIIKPTFDRQREESGLVSIIMKE